MYTKYTHTLHCDVSQTLANNSMVQCECFGEIFRRILCFVVVVLPSIHDIDTCILDSVKVEHCERDFQRNFKLIDWDVVCTGNISVFKLFKCKHWMCRLYHEFLEENNAFVWYESALQTANATLYCSMRWNRGWLCLPRLFDCIRQWLVRFDPVQGVFSNCNFRFLFSVCVYRKRTQIYVSNEINKCYSLFG